MVYCAINYPEKKAKVLELLTQEGLVVNENMSPNSPLKRSKFNSPLKKLHEMMSSPKPRIKKIESPSALGRRRALQRLESESSLEDIQSPEKSIRRPSNAPEVPYNEILKNLIVYCEVRSNGEDRSSSIKTMVRALGATVRDKITRDVTHVIFKDGLYSTFRKAQNMKMHIVSVLWLDAVRRYKCQMPEGKYKPLDFDKYNNMNESQVCQEIEEEFNDVLTDELRRSAVKKPQFESRINNQKICTESFLNNDPQQDVDQHRPDFVTPSNSSSRCSSPTVSKGDSNVSCSPINNNNNNNDLLVVPCSQNDSHSFTHARKSTNLSRVVEETFNNRSASPSPSNIAKHVRDSFELKSVRNLKSPPHEIAEKSIESRRSSASRISVNDEESIRLHVTTTTDQSFNSSRKRSSSNFAQKLLTTELAASNDLNRVSTGTAARSSASSTDLLNGPINNNKNRRRTTIGLSRSRKSSVVSVENVAQTNENLNEKTNNLLNNVENLLINQTANRNTTTTRKGRARKLFKGDHIDESLFNWDKAKELPPIEMCTTPPKKRKVELPPYFPKNLSSKARKKASTVKKSTTKNENVNNNVPAKETLAKILDFGEKDTNVKPTGASSDSDSKNKEKSICGIIAIEDSSKENIETNIKPKRTLRKSLKPKNDKTLNSTEDTEVKKITDKRPKRKSIVAINYILTDDSDENQPATKKTDRGSNLINSSTEKTDESYKTATSDLSSVKKPKTRKSSRITISSISSNNSENDQYSPKNSKSNNKRKSRFTISNTSSDNSDPSSPKTSKSSQITQIPKNTPARTTRQSIIKNTPVQPSVVKETPKSKINSPQTPNIRKKIPNTPANNKILTKAQNFERTPNRRSTMEFLPRSSRKSLARIKATEEPKQVPVKISSIVCTRFHREETQVFAQIVSKLGGFHVEDEVTKRTSHLVCGGPIRTVNLLRAIARGCWILRKEWLYKSLEAGRWLEEEDYEMIEFSPAVQKCRLEKQSFGSLYSMDLFKNCGTIFISRGSNPRCSDLEELVQLCGGRIVRIVRDADIIVGKKTRNDNNNSVSVTEKWVLDSITDNKKKSFKNYEIFDADN